MAVTFYGNGTVFIPEGRRFIRFVNGEYTTDKSNEIAALIKTFNHDIIQPDSIPEQVENIDIPKRGRKPKNA